MFNAVADKSQGPWSRYSTCKSVLPGPVQCVWVEDKYLLC